MALLKVRVTLYPLMRFLEEQEVTFFFLSGTNNECVLSGGKIFSNPTIMNLRLREDGKLTIRRDRLLHDSLLFLLSSSSLRHRRLR